MPKRSNSEVGHAKMVTNLAELISRCIGYGAPYNPGRPDLQISSLQQLHQEAQMALRMVTEREVMNQQATNERKKAFKLLRPKVTRVINTMIAYEVSAKSVEDARAIQRRINGIRANKKNNEASTPDVPETPETIAATDANTETLTQSRLISVSRQSFDLLLEHFSKLRLLLQREGSYQPNEEELSLAGLQAFEEQLRYLQEMVISTETELENARIQRTEVLYKRANNVVDRASQVKSYVKGVFGTNSPQYRQIAKLTFRKTKS